ncbi:ATP-binding cassette domain-containing protein [Maribacter sp. X9]|uniref:ATP-binding cassette domain-containing protein n=1 Tax=Maribacter sp. X9 TaxID=3402159 RepID=UPI003AF3B9BF
MKLDHWVIHLDNDSAKKDFIEGLLKGNGPKELEDFQNRKGALFSPLTLAKLIDEEDKRDYRIISPVQQAIETMSSGEQKKALLFYLLRKDPDFIILDNPLDNLDTSFQAELKALLTERSTTISFIQLASRKTDTLPFIHNHGRLEGAIFRKINPLQRINPTISDPFSTASIPPSPILKSTNLENPLIQFRNVCVSYENKVVLKDIDWTVNKGDFWQLTGANGSGKTTMLSMIIGDNPKAFGQEIYLFGRKKGSGESVWEIKQKIGYYSPAMTNKFKGRHSVEHMLISGLTDSVGLYTIPTEGQKRISEQWLHLLNLYAVKDTYFNKLSVGKQRLVLTARAMVKHPPLLILDEPTADMDDVSAELIVALVNKISKETNTAIIFVSHRKEPGLEPKSVYTLQKTKLGTLGTTTKA